MDITVVWIVVAALVASIVKKLINNHHALEMAKLEKGVVDSNGCECNETCNIPSSKPLISDDPSKFTVSNIICMALMGVGISALISLGFSIGFNSFLPAPPSAVEKWGLIGAAGANYAAGAIMAIASYSLGDIFKITAWPMWKRTLVHFVSLYVAFFLSSYLGHWVDYSSPASILLSLPIFTAMYFITWTITSMKYKKQLEMMNEKLSQINNN